MDLSFFRRAEEGFASRTAAPLEFGMLAAMLRTQQAASPAAQAQALALALPCQDPLAELLLGGPAWRGAAAALRGSFNPACARTAYAPPAFARQGTVN